jgi:hypothetical protein
MGSGSKWKVMTDFGPSGWALGKWQDKVQKQMIKALDYYSDYLLTRMMEEKHGEEYWYGVASKFTNKDNYEYPGIKSGALGEAIMNPSNHKIEWDGKVCRGYVNFDNPDYGIETLDGEIFVLPSGLSRQRPWRARAFIECEDKIKEILAGLNVILMGTSIEAKWFTRWEKNY